jgi:hypothetical protein
VPVHEDMQNWAEKEDRERERTEEVRGVLCDQKEQEAGDEQHCTEALPGGPKAF